MGSDTPAPAKASCIAEFPHGLPHALEDDFGLDDGRSNLVAGALDVRHGRVLHAPELTTGRASFPQQYRTGGGRSAGR